MSGYVQVWKSLAGDWSVGCDECGTWLVSVESWSDAQREAVMHVRQHERKRCQHCGRSS